MTKVDYAALIPNNVDLAADRSLARALERWHPQFLDWWLQMGPDGFQEADVYLRTAVNVERAGWAKFGFVKMPEYRWGILLAPAEPERKIPFGDHKGEPAWQEVPGECRSLLRRLLVIQGDTEPASVEQQRFLGQTAPSLYDMRNLFQVNVEEARHLWAMAYLLHKFFGRDGREEAEALLQRRSGDADKPRILGAFNEETPDWLSFFMFTSFTDRDGNMQLGALAESGFDPLSRTCRFMLTEEGHHMFVGKSGVERILQRTCEAMNEAGIADASNVDAVRDLGVFDLPMIQKKVNFHYSVSLDLFGSEISTNAANAFAAGIKGRFKERDIEDDHQLHGATYPVTRLLDGAIEVVEMPALNALNARLMDDYIADAGAVVEAWNRVVTKNSVEFELTLPHRGFNRRIGEFRDAHVSPDGRVLSESAWSAKRDGWLPTSDDLAYTLSLMQSEVEAGSYAGWIAPAKGGIGGKPGDFEYVRLAS